ncbi:hypothetical protein M413DRAFT_445227 [Hebeloma cylindrosporum]|uniref:Uncharacterized protein n=1 Tax=Hebeloma cylindrosporum TaxID=76867 RepID=A0A0C3BZN1_HEBCY|nr:hypothetical protein M413DRAFT_445227 [Hebeloma cylindrosporum h7]
MSEISEAVPGSGKTCGKMALLAGTPPGRIKRIGKCGKERSRHSRLGRKQNKVNAKSRMAHPTKLRNCIPDAI